MKCIARLIVSVMICLSFSAAGQTAGQTNNTSVWWNPAESGWGLNLTHQGTIVFAALFTYRGENTNGSTTNEPTWLVMSRGDVQADGKTFTGDLFKATGTPFAVTPFVPLTSNNVTFVGQMTIEFATNNSATLTYTVNGIQITKQIVKQDFGGNGPAICTFTDNPNRSSATNYQDLWWNPSESGWGVNLSHQNNAMFATLFIYDASGRDIWLVMTNGQKQTDGSYLGDLYKTTGSAFNASPFVPLTSGNVTTVGTMRFTFTDGQTGRLTYTVNGVTVTKSIARQVYASPVSVCTTPTFAPKLLLPIATPSQNSKQSLMVVDLVTGVLSSTGITSATSLGCEVGNLKSTGVARIACGIGGSHWDYNPVTNTVTQNTALTNLPISTWYPVVSSPLGTDYYGVGPNIGNGQVLVRNGNSFTGAIDISTKSLQYVAKVLADFPSGKLFTLNQNLNQVNNPATLPARVDRIDIASSRVDASFSDTVPGIDLALYNGELYMAKYRDGNGMDVVKYNASTFQKAGEGMVKDTLGSGGVQFVYVLAVDANGVHFGINGGIQTLAHDLKTVLRTSKIAPNRAIVELTAYNGKLYAGIASISVNNVLEVDSATGVVLRTWSVPGSPYRPTVVSN